MIHPVVRFLVFLAAILSLSPLHASADFRIQAANSDPVLQQRLERRVTELGLAEAARNGKLEIALVDITDIDNPRLAAINGNEMVYAASLPKIAILFGAFVKVERGEMALTDENRALLTKMIRYSSNRAATEMLNRVGKAYLAAVLQDPRYRLYCEALNGGLWVGKEYGRGVAWKRDPLHHLSHGATAIQTARLYYLLESGQLLRPDLAAEMKTILGDPGIEHKFVKGLKKAAPEAVIYRKSGSWRHYHADSAIVEHDGRRYIAVALAQDPNGGQWLSRLIVAMDELIRQPRPVAWLKH